MNDLSRLFKSLSDETRLRVCHLLAREELSPSEIGEVLNLAQPLVSKQLAALRETLPIRERREGRRVFLEMDRESPQVRDFFAWIDPQFLSSEVCRRDLARLRATREKKQFGYEAAAPGDLGRRYLPGRTWEGLARTLLTLVPPRSILDIGIGDGELTLLLAKCASRLVAVDPDRGALQRLEKKSLKAGCTVIETRVGVLEDLPLDEAEVDLVFASQVFHHSDDMTGAFSECKRVLTPGGRLVVLDLLAHREDWVRGKLSHSKLGFEAEELLTAISAAGFENASVYPVARDRKSPHFVTLLATGSKPVPESSTPTNSETD
ncbi:MAG: metalloregulator ArsR/SmtB family transcription factor [Planctomycetota bacterium]